MARQAPDWLAGLVLIGFCSAVYVVAAALGNLG